MCSKKKFVLTVSQREFHTSAIHKYLEPIGEKSSHASLLRIPTMRPKARGLAQHGGPSGWLEESDQQGFNFVRDGRSMPPALTE